MAGFMGYDYDKELKGLKPRIGWMIGRDKIEGEENEERDSAREFQEE